MDVFEYGQAEIDHLRQRDPILGEAIDRIGPIERRIIPDPFEALVNSVVSQQISGKAAETVFGRLRGLLGEIAPRSVCEAGAADIQRCGLSMRKAGYIVGIAQASCSGMIDFSALREMADEQVVAALSALPGVGVWTAQMLLIFSLRRPDVVSWGDLGIRRGMMRLYGLSELERETFEAYRMRYSPYGSVASLYLWALSGADGARRSIDIVSSPM